MWVLNSTRVMLQEWRSGNKVILIMTTITLPFLTYITVRLAVWAASTPFRWKKCQR